MRFQVPQFVDVEDKIFGPFTLKQFIYLGGGAGLIIALFTTVPKVLAFFLSIPIVLLSLSLTFFKLNNQPFILILESFFKYITNKKLYIWKKEEAQVKKKSAEETNTEMYVPKLSQSKLKDLSWSLDVKNTGTQQEEPGSGEKV